MLRTQRVQAAEEQGAERAGRMAVTQVVQHGVADLRGQRQDALGAPFGTRHAQFPDAPADRVEAQGGDLAGRKP